MSHLEDRGLLALFPAAGSASRLPAKEQSKEVLVVGTDPDTGLPRLACQDLLDAFAAASPEALLVLTRRDKLEVPRRLVDLSLPYPMVTLVVGATPSVVHTIDAAWPFTRGRRIALGFPDVLLEPVGVFGALSTAQVKKDAPVVLGLFPAAEPDRSDVVELEAGGRVRRLAVKEAGTGLALTWMTAVWSGELTEFLHGFLRSHQAHGRVDLQLGHVLAAALREGMRIETVVFPRGRVLDVGTPESLAAAPSWVAARGRPGTIPRPR